MHGAILGAALGAANAILPPLLRETICDFDRARYFSRPRTPMRRVDLLTWSGSCRTESANEVAQIMNEKTIR